MKKNKSYSLEFKEQVVTEYLERRLGYRRLAKKYGIPSMNSIRIWVEMYEAYGVEGLEPVKKKENHTVKFKMDVLKFNRETGSSFTETAIAYGMKSPTLIAKWSKDFEKHGRFGLEKKRRPSMTKKQKKHDKQTEQYVKSLEHRIEYLELELAYEKKLQAFRKNPSAFLGKYNQNSHSNSNKKDSN